MTAGCFFVKVRQHGRVVCCGEDLAGSGESLHQRLRHTQWVSWDEVFLTTYRLSCFSWWRDVVFKVHRLVFQTPGTVQGSVQTGAGLRCGIHRRLLPQVQSEFSSNENKIKWQITSRLGLIPVNENDGWKEVSCVQSDTFFLLNLI